VQAWHQRDAIGGSTSFTVPYFYEYGKYPRNKNCGKRGGNESCIYCTILVGKPEAKLQLKRNGRNLEDTVIMDLKKVGYMGVDCFV
jgi:hypothetical protein